MSDLRTNTIYVSHDLRLKLSLIAKKVKASCVDEYAEQVLTEHIKAMYGDSIDNAVAAAQKAWGKAIDEGMAGVETNEPKEQ